MASTERNAGTGTDGGESINPTWTDVGNIVSSNNANSVVALSSTNNISNSLTASNFGFMIPSFATIDGIICTVERRASASNTIADYSVRIVKNGSIPAGSDDKKNIGTFWSTVEGDESYGSPADLWNTTWSASDINNTNFGFAIRCEYIPAYSVETALVDLMYITIYYTIDNLNFGTTSISKAYYVSTEIKSVYYGSTQIV